MQETKIRQKKSSKKVVLIVAIAVFSVFAALAFGGIIGMLAYYSFKDGNLARSEAVGSLVTPRDMISPEQEIQAKKDFLESFYKGMEKSNDVDSYVLKFITSNAKRILIEEYDYECDGDCLATWLFDSEAGSDTGPFVSRTINVKNEDNFLVVTKYVDAEYEVRLSVIKVGDSYKIDDIEKIRATYKTVTTDTYNNSNEDIYSSSNSSSVSRTFYDEQIVVGYLANQTFRSSNGFTIRFDGSGRMYAEGDFAGVVSVLHNNSTSAMLRYGGGQYTEGQIRVDIVGDKFQLTDPVDGTVYYQR